MLDALVVQVAIERLGARVVPHGLSTSRAGVLCENGTFNSSYRTGARQDASDRPGRSNLQRDLNDIGVRSFILTGAPVKSGTLPKPPVLIEWSGKLWVSTIAPLALSALPSHVSPRLPVRRIWIQLGRLRPLATASPGAKRRSMISLARSISAGSRTARDLSGEPAGIGLDIDHGHGAVELELGNQVEQKRGRGPAARPTTYCLAALW